MTHEKEGRLLPSSVVDGRGIVIATVCLLLSLSFCKWAQTPPIVTVLTALLAWAAPVALFDLIVGRVHLRPSTGLDPALRTSRRPDLRRLGVKMLGMTATLFAVGAFWFAWAGAFPQLFALFLYGLMLILPMIIGISIAYVVLIDGMMKEPHDALFEVGSLALGRWKDRDWRALREYALGWAIKGFFLPLMFGYLAGRAAYLLTSEPLGGGTDIFTAILWIVGIGVLIDLVVVVCGYALTLRPLDTHIRSTNPSPLGWFVCLACYVPFNAVTLWLIFKYRDGMIWADWMADHLWLAVPWAVAILFFQGSWVCTNLMFGLRFSNLTHRGIITNGPFRYTKHPSYVSKNVSWWLIHVPFLSAVGWDQALLHITGLVGVNIVYYLRAKTEERHLMEDPVYREYAAWIEEHGVLARLPRLLRQRRDVKA